MKLLKLRLSKFNFINAFDFLVVILGIVMISIGLYKIYPPAMWIVIGAILAFPGLSKKEVK